MSQEELKQRALKITEALYRTTDLFSDAEPLKWSLRQTALDILNLRRQDFLGFEESVKNISLKLDLASSGTFISKTNFEVIKRAYMELLSNTVSLRGNYESLFLSDKPTNAISDKKEMSVMPAHHNNNSNRQEALVLALKQKGPLSVGDLVKLIDVSISEKTVQRELAGLVASGTIKQEGEKRWRRYFIGSSDAVVGAPTTS